MNLMIHRYIPSQDMWLAYINCATQAITAEQPVLTLWQLYSVFRFPVIPKTDNGHFQKFKQEESIVQKSVRMTLRVT